MAQDYQLIVRKSANLKASYIFPGDKSISHRALLFAAQAIGPSVIHNLNTGHDVACTIEVLRKLTVDISLNDGDYIISSNKKFCDNIQIDCANSGTLARLLFGFLVANNISAEISGDESLCNRPMQRAISYLSAVNANIRLIQNNYLPAKIVKAQQQLLPLNCEITQASAQIKASLIFYGLNIEGQHKIIQKNITRDHSERLMKKFGINFEHYADQIKFNGQQNFYGKEIFIPGDPSSAAFLIVATLITENSYIKLERILLNEHRIKFLEILQSMNANIAITNIYEDDYEKYGDITVYTSQLNAIEIDGKYSAQLIDEYPILAIAAACADGVSQFNNLYELTIKESNRLEAIRDNLVKCNVKAYIEDENLTIIGQKYFDDQEKVVIDPKFDHRIAMAFACLGLKFVEPIKILNAKCINTSFPEFYSMLKNMGANIFQNNNVEIND